MENTDKRKVICEVYSRIVGYLRPIQNWNKGKLQEFKERKTYSLAAALQHAQSIKEVQNVRATATI